MASRPGIISRARPDSSLGLLWGAVALSLLALSPLAPRIAAGLPACAFRGLSGIPCPSCGAVRSALALTRFDLVEAFAASPLAALGWVALVGGGLIAGGASILGYALPEPPNRLSVGARVIVVGLVLANWLYVVARSV